MDEKDIAPDVEAISLRNGYNQTYIVKSSKNNLHQVLFRCGNWCYTGNVDLGSKQLSLGDLEGAIPALQKQQGSLQFLCEWSKMPKTCEFLKPLNTLYDGFDFIGDQLVSDEIVEAIQDAAEENAWVDEEDGTNYFELQTSGMSCFEGIDIIASKTIVRELTLLVIYYQNSLYIVLQEGKEDQPLLDVKFPDLSDHLQGLQLKAYPNNDQYEKLLLWQAVKPDGSKKSVPRQVKVACNDVSGTGYTQTFLIRKTHPGSGNNLREILFRFGNWCYNGHVDLGPKLDLGDIPIIIPLLRRQQSALTFMCESSKMPATSLFAPSMLHLADICPIIQQELAVAEEILVDLAEQGSVEGVGDITSWLEDEHADCYFELAVDACDDLKDVEVIASKVYLGSIVLVIMYFQQKFYVMVMDGTNEQPLLDTRFPDITCPSKGFQLKTYRSGCKAFEELRRISLWRTGASVADISIADKDPVLRANPEKEQISVAEPKNEPKEDPINNATESKSASKPVDKSAKLSSLGKVGRPHHIAPLKKLGAMDGADSKLAPWDATGKPLGATGSRK